MPLEQLDHIFIHILHWLLHRLNHYDIHYHTRKNLNPHYYNKQQSKLHKEYQQEEEVIHFRKHDRPGGHNYYKQQQKVR